MKIIPRSEVLPVFPNSYYQGPYTKLGVCLHHMAIPGGDPITLEQAKQRTKANYEHQRSRWGAIDILEGYDLYDVNGEPTLIECRPWWSNCDAFSGSAKLGHKYIGIEVHGNYVLRKPSPVILEGIVRALVWLKETGRIMDIHMRGHRDFNGVSTVGPTSCPGGYLYEAIPTLVAKAKARLEKIPKAGGAEKVVDFLRQEAKERGQGIFDGKEVEVWRAFGCGSEYLHFAVTCAQPGEKIMLFADSPYAGKALGSAVVAAQFFGNRPTQLSTLIPGVGPNDYVWLTIHMLPDTSRRFRGFIRA